MGKCPLTVLAGVFILIVSMIAPAVALDYLRSGDFDKESWSKVVDYLEYVDVYAVTHGKPRPPAGARANLFMTYVNYQGVQMLYAGLSNVTMALGALAVTAPIQTFMLHYKTENQSRNAVSASSFIMLLAYNETVDSDYPGSPDKNDTLFASFSMGFDLSSIISTDAPALNSKTTIIPLTHPETNRWHWGMSYTNLTAIWWNVYFTNSSYNSIPIAVTVYEELTFTYDLIFNPENKSAKIVSNYVIGRMTDLWVVDTWWFGFIPIVVHYNSTGCYRLNKSLYSDETIYEFLNRHGISMSMVFFHASAILEHTTQSKVNGQEVAGEEVDVSNETVSTFTEDGERVSDVDFGTKNSYNLHNFTSGNSATYSAITRTVERQGIADNPIFEIQTFLMKYIPLALAHMDEDLYEQAKNQLLNMEYADYFYIISYPTYDGYAVEHDPIHTVFYTAATTAPSGIGGFIALMIIVAVIIIAVIGIMRIRKKPPESTGPSLLDSEA